MNFSGWVERIILETNDYVGDEPDRDANPGTFKTNLYYIIFADFGRIILIPHQSVNVIGVRCSCIHL